jgi:quercetin 2,3-dioxygenase
MATRRVQAVLRSVPTTEGAGVRLRRAFGYAQVPRLDPFLMLDDIHCSNPADYLGGFPWHPHRGIETITYVIEGLVEHGDSLGNRGAIGAGDVQWMTAGCGVIHQEMPCMSPTGIMWGLQLWANLPAESKMMPPRYRDVTARDIPSVVLDSGVTVRVVCGEVAGTSGPVRDIVIDPTMLDVTVPAGGAYAHPVEPGHTAFAYVLDGAGWFGEPVEGWRARPLEEPHGPEELVLYAHEGDEIAVTAEADGVRFLLLTGRPLGEPVAWRGPIVMNTEEELRTAFAEFEQGTFLSHG